MGLKCPEKKKCAFCGKEFLAKTYNHIYCSKTCCDKAYRKRRIERDKDFLKREYERGKKYYRSETKILGWKKYRIKMKKTINKIIGSNCSICNSSRHLVCHEIHGKPHIYSYADILKHSQDFVRMCYTCHTFLHKLHKKGNPKTFQELLSLLKGEDKWENKN